MEISQFFFTLFCTVFFCLGLSIVTDAGMVLYFIRRPFDEIQKKIEANKDRIAAIENFNPIANELTKLRKQNKIYSVIYYWSKPFITCITCMASFWGAVIFIGINGFHLKWILLICVIASFIQTFIYRIYERFL